MKKKLAFILILFLFIMNGGFSSNSQTINGPTNQIFESLTINQFDEPIEISSNAELAQESSAGVGTRNDPYIIEGYRIDGANSFVVRDTTAFFILRNSEISYSADRGGISVVRFLRVEHGTIENCYISGGDVAVSIAASMDCTISNCVIYGAYNGLLVESSNNCTIIDSSSFGNYIGAMLVNSDRCNIVNNSIYSNSERGVHVEVFCENNTIAGNEIGWNSNLNAIDNGVNTQYSHRGVIGNAWSDANTTGAYSIQGTAGSADDNARLLTDTVQPIVFGVLDTVIDVESNGETITWTVSDDFHFQYNITIEDGVSLVALWDGREINLSLDNLGIGTYTIIMTVTDGAGNTATDIVDITVISFILGGIGTELVMLASGVTLVSFLVILFIIKRVS